MYAHKFETNVIVRTQNNRSTGWQVSCYIISHHHLTLHQGRELNISCLFPTKLAITLMTLWDGKSWVGTLGTAHCGTQRDTTGPTYVLRNFFFSSIYFKISTAVVDWNLRSYSTFDQFVDSKGYPPFWNETYFNKSLKLLVR